MTDIQVRAETYIEALREQRNALMDECAKYIAQIKHLEQEISELRDKKDE